MSWSRLWLAVILAVAVLLLAACWALPMWQVRISGGQVPLASVHQVCGSALGTIGQAASSKAAQVCTAVHQVFVLRTVIIWGAVVAALAAGAGIVSVEQRYRK